MTQPLTDEELLQIEMALADVRDGVRGSIWTEENQERYRRRDQVFARYGRQLFEEVKRRRAEKAEARVAELEAALRGFIECKDSRDWGWLKAEATKVLGTNGESR